jgi:hypothetical protein
VLGGLALEGADAGADAPGRDQEDRQQHQRHHGDRPRQAEHHAERQGEGDHVGHHARQRRGEGPLGADDVVVESADERAGVGAGEEGDRLALDVREHLPPQVEDQAFAETRRLQPFEQPDHALDDGHAGDHEGQGHDGARRLAVDDGVHGPTGEQGRGHAEHGAEGGEDEERHDRPAQRSGEVEHPTQRPAADRPSGTAVLLHGALQRAPEVHVAHGRVLRSPARVPATV